MVEGVTPETREGSKKVKDCAFAQSFFMLTKTTADCEQSNIRVYKTGVISQNAAYAGERMC